MKTALVVSVLQSHQFNYPILHITGQIRGADTLEWGCWVSFEAVQDSLITDLALKRKSWALSSISSSSFTTAWALHHTQGLSLVFFFSHSHSHPDLSRILAALRESHADYFAPKRGVFIHPDKLCPGCGSGLNITCRPLCARFKDSCPGSH